LMPMVLGAVGYVPSMGDAARAALHQTNDL